MAKKQSNRYRNYAFIVYPESAPDNWLALLEDIKIPCLISPLHDSDINADGNPKKEHFHVILCFDGVKTREQAEEIIQSVGGVGCEVVNSIRGYARYLCHLDNPEKARYDIANVISYGVDYNNCISLNSDKYGIIRNMIQYCDDNNIHSYAQLIRYCMQNNEEWFTSLCDNSTYVIKEYLKSKSWEIRPTDSQNADLTNSTCQAPSNGNN